MNYFDEAVTKSLDDFMESYKIVDTEEIYSNGTEFVPIFRVKQWEEYNNKDKEIDRLNSKVEELMTLYTTEREVKEDYKSIIKEVREYITSYESIETIQQFDHNKNNKDLDYSTIDEMTRRYMIVHDKLLEILDEEKV